MPDMIDVVLARALTPQGQIQSAARQAREAVADANDAVETIESLTSEAERIQQLSRTTLTEITSISEYAEEIKDGLAVVDEAILGELNDEINKLAFELNAVNGANARVNNIKISYPNGEKVQTLQGVVKYYNTIGQNQDGTMTQKAITNALAQGGIGGNANLGPENAGKMVKVGSDGYLTPSEITQEALLNGDIHIEPTNPDTPDDPNIPSSVVNNGVLGIKINYTTGVITPTDDNANNGTTQLFNQYNMYGGRKRCIVDNSGAIIAFYDEQNYNEQPSNGYQVMVYQPKFYYKRTPISTTQTTNGEKINEQIIKISDVKKDGFKAHPLFVDANNNELSYVLLSAYEGSIEDTEANNSYKNIIYNNFTSKKLSSVINAQPITGQNNNLNLINAQQLANNRGNGWHITNIEALSAEQLLEIIELNSLNGQSSFYPGITGVQYGNVQNHNKAKTGSTTSLGNISGKASQTIITNESGNSTVMYSNNTTAITYRGLENFWGNQWKIINGIICKTADDANTNDIYITHNSSNIHLSFMMPESNGWISQFGYDENCDWVFLPIECGQNANSLGPIGDLYYNIVNTKDKILMHGGMYLQGSQAGLFNYLTQYDNTDSLVRTTARLLYIPSKTNINYTTNIAKWVTAMGG